PARSPVRSRTCRPAHGSTSWSTTPDTPPSTTASSPPPATATRSATEPEHPGELAGEQVTALDPARLGRPQYPPAAVGRAHLSGPAVGSQRQDHLLQGRGVDRAGFTPGGQVVDVAGDDGGVRAGGGGSLALGDVGDVPDGEHVGL